jgi:hypothetical protein
VQFEVPLLRKAIMKNIIDINPANAIAIAPRLLILRFFVPECEVIIEGGCTM